MKIMRIYRCTVVAGKEAEFREFAFKKSHPWLRTLPGLVAFYAGRSMSENTGRMRCMAQIWESPDALRDALGDDWDKQPKLAEEVRVFIESATVEHYELADIFEGQDDAYSS